MERLRNIKLVRSLQELQDSANHLQKLTGPYAEVASYNGATSDPGEYRRGENKAITDWYWQQKPRVDLAERLTAYASLPQTIAGRSFAEQIIARNFAEQLYSGATSLDFTQQYATDDHASAMWRHERALDKPECISKKRARWVIRSIPVRRSRSSSIRHAGSRQATACVNGGSMRNCHCSNKYPGRDRRYPGGSQQGVASQSFSWES